MSKKFLKKATEKEGIRTDMKTEDGATYILKYGRFGAYLESENYASDELRISLPSEIKKLLDSLETKNDVLLIKAKFDIAKQEEKEF